MSLHQWLQQEHIVQYVGGRHGRCGVPVPALAQELQISQVKQHYYRMVLMSPSIPSPLSGL